MAAEGSVLLVAETSHDSALVGAVYLRIYDTPPAPEMRPRRRLHVESLVVAKAQRRLSIGRNLMAAAEVWGRARGAEQVVLTVWAGNQNAARFYRALGYEPAATVLSRELA